MCFELLNLKTWQWAVSNECEDQYTALMLLT